MVVVDTQPTFGEGPWDKMNPLDPVLVERAAAQGFEPAEIKGWARVRLSRPPPARHADGPAPPAHARPHRFHKTSITT